MECQEFSVTIYSLRPRTPFIEWVLGTKLSAHKNDHSLVMQTQTVEHKKQRDNKLDIYIYHGGTAQNNSPMRQHSAQ